MVDSVSWAARWIGFNDDWRVNRNRASEGSRQREGGCRDNDAHAAKAIRRKSKRIKLSVYYLQACMKQCRHSLFEHHDEEIEDMNQ